MQQPLCFYNTSFNTIITSRIATATISGIVQRPLPLPVPSDLGGVSFPPRTNSARTTSKRPSFNAICLKTTTATTTPTNAAGR